MGWLGLNMAINTTNNPQEGSPQKNRNLAQISTNLNKSYKEGEREVPWTSINGQ